MNFQNFQLNLLPSISEGFNSHIPTLPNVIGASEIPFGMRRLVINKKNGIQLEDSMTTLAGKIIHYALEKPEVVYNITRDINKALGYTEKEVNGNRFIELQNGKYMRFKIETEKERLIEIQPKKYLRLHSDIHTSLYTIEFKTTSIPKDMWSDLAPYNIAQLNSYLAFGKHDFGILLKMDLNFIKSKSEKWEFIWNKYFLPYPLNFNKELFEFIIDKTKEFFRIMEINKDDLNMCLDTISCPEFVWECDNDCKKFCPNPIDKVKVKVNETCEHCKEEIRADTQLLIRNGKSFHYTNERGNPYEQCVEAAKKDYKCEVKE